MPKYARGVVGAVAVSLLALALPAQSAPYLRPGANERISIGYDGSQAKDPVDAAIGTVWESAISANGRFVAFSSTAVNLVPGDVNEASDIFVRDRVTNKTEIVSVASDGTRAIGACPNGNVGSLAPSISSDGRFVAYSSCASNLVPHDLNLARDGFVYDRRTRRTEMVSLSSDGRQGTMPLINHDSFAVGLSPEGRYVAITSYASDLVPNDTNDYSDAFLYDRATKKIQRISVSSAEQQGTSTGPLGGRSNAHSVSANGKFVEFSSLADNLVPGDTNQTTDVFVRDMTKGITERISVRTGGAQTNVNSSSGASNSGGRAISADGRFVMFNSLASNLVPNDTNGTGLSSAADTYVYDRKTGRTQRISVGSDGHEANGSSNTSSLSLDGRYVAFSSVANNLAEGDTGSNGSSTVPVGSQPGDSDVLIYDRAFGTVELISRAPNGDDAKGHCKILNDVLAADAGESFGGAVSDDGQYVSYQSCATNLVPGDTNATRDQFVRYRGPHLGVGVVSAKGGGTVTLSGWATFSGAVLADAADPANDGLLDAALTGSELVGGELLYRPELDDLLLRLDLTQIPSAGVALGGVSAPGDPRVLYSMRFAANGQNYEVRVARAGANTSNPLDASYGLFSCTEVTCSLLTELHGGYGTTGEQIVVSIPLDAIKKDGKALGEGATLTILRGYTAYGSYFGGATELLDQVLLSRAASIRIPTKTITLTVGGVSRAATITNGTFSATFPRAALHGSTASVLIKTCLGTTCQQNRFPVRI